MNGLRYHYQHSGAHGQIGLQMLSNGTHPPPAYPPGHKRATNKPIGHSMGEFSTNPSPTVVMNQSTAEALLAAISSSGNPLAGQNQGQSRPSSRAGTPSIMTPDRSRGPSPARTQQKSPSRSGSTSSGNISVPPSYNVTSIPLSS